MDVYSLTNQVNTTWGVRYNCFNWRDDWEIHIKNYRRTVYFEKKYNWNTPIMAWFDMNILQRIGIDSDFTIRVRIRILCGMINKIPPHIYSREMKISFMECVWDIYKQFKKSWEDWHCKYELGLPF